MKSVFLRQIRFLGCLVMLICLSACKPQKTEKNQTHEEKKEELLKVFHHDGGRLFKDLIKRYAGSVRDAIKAFSQEEEEEQRNLDSLIAASSFEKHMDLLNKGGLTFGQEKDRKIVFFIDPLCHTCKNIIMIVDHFIRYAMQEKAHTSVHVYTIPFAQPQSYKACKLVHALSKLREDALVQIGYISHATSLFSDEEIEKIAKYHEVDFLKLKKVLEEDKDLDEKIKYGGSLTKTLHIVAAPMAFVYDKGECTVYLGEKRVKKLAKTLMEYLQEAGILKKDAVASSASNSKTENQKKEEVSALKKNKKKDLGSSAPSALLPTSENFFNASTTQENNKNHHINKKVSPAEIPGKQILSSSFSNQSEQKSDQKDVKDKGLEKLSVDKKSSNKNTKKQSGNNEKEFKQPSNKNVSSGEEKKPDHPMKL